MCKLNIRRMAEGDLDQVCAIEEETFSMPWSRKSFQDTISYYHTLFLVAELEGKIAGYAGCYQSLEEAEITNIAVKRELRGQGIGRKLLMELIPNVHLLGVLVVAFTVVYRKKALYPIYIYVLLNGIFCGFAAWWVPYLYVWTVLWGAVMLLPQKMPKAIRPVVYMAVCSAHGFLFGTLYAPAQALLYGLSLEGMVGWIIAGLPWDCIHGVSNFFCGILIVPVISALRFAEERFARLTE